MAVAVAVAIGNHLMARESQRQPEAWDQRTLGQRHIRTSGL